MSPSAGGSSQLRRPPRSIPGALRSSLRSPCPARGPGRTKPSGPSLLLAEARHRPPRRGTQPRPRPTSCAPPSLGPAGCDTGGTGRDPCPHGRTRCGVGRARLSPDFQRDSGREQRGVGRKAQILRFVLDFCPEGSWWDGTCAQVLVPRSPTALPRGPIRQEAAQPPRPPKKSPAGRTWRAHGEMEEAFGVSNRQALRPEDG